MPNKKKLSARLHDRRDAVLAAWLKDLDGQLDRDTRGFRDDASTILDLLITQCGHAEERWDEAADSLTELARARVAAGFATDETITLVSALRSAALREVAALDDIELLRHLSKLLDVFLRYLVDAYVEARDLVIARQQEDLLELSTPAVKLWDGIVAVPLVGTLDSRRAVSVMESLLNKISETQSTIAIIDITGVPTVDTQVAQHILRTVAAARLTGARCILCGIRPSIAHTMVELGIELSQVETHANLAAAFAAALRSRGLDVRTSDA